MARNISIHWRYPIINGYVQFPPCLESKKTETIPDDENVVDTGAGLVYENSVEEL